MKGMKLFGTGTLVGRFAMRSVGAIIPAQFALLALLAVSPWVSRAEARAAVHTDRGNAYAGPRGAAISGPNRTAVATRRGAVATGPHGAAAVRHPGALPRGYIRALPGGYRPVIYRGVRAYYANGIYYRQEVYNGSTVYVAIQ